MPIKSITIDGKTVKDLTLNGGTVFHAGGSEPPVLLSWEHVIWSIEQGSYATDYSIGDLIPLDLGTEGNINMQIAAFDADDLASGNGKAHISFISKELLNTSRRMNPKLEGGTFSQPGTGSIDGWEKSEMRTYLKNNVKLLIPSNVRQFIVEVTKTQLAYDITQNTFTQTTQDYVWIPAWNEIGSSTDLYGALFSDDESRIKYPFGASSAYGWWTRQAHSARNFGRVKPDGSRESATSESLFGIALGFCL